MNVTVIVHAQSKRRAIITGRDGFLHAYVGEPAREGKANEAVRAALARHFSVALSCVQLKRGASSKQKQFIVLT